MDNYNHDLTQEFFEKLKSIRLIVFDFDGVFTDNAVWVMEDGTEMVRCSRSDGLGLQKLNILGIENLIISTETNPVVAARSKKLNIRCIQGCKDKLDKLKTVAVERGIDFSQIAFVGNDINDTECLKRVGIPIVVKDAHPDVSVFAEYMTKCKGGYGAVREICDIFAQAYSV